MGSKYTKRYTEEFKRDAIALVDSSGKTVTAVARELGISSESLRGWYRRAKADRGEGAPGELTSAEREELRRLRRENREQQQTIEILKKATAFFARSAVGDSLAFEQAQAVAEEARAWRGANAFRLVRYLSDRPDALSMPSSDCPTCVVRLLVALTAAGHGDKVTLVACGDCGRTDPLPTNNGPEGRLCSRCAGRRAKKPCARCGKVASIYARRPEGGICNPCRDKEPDAKE
ncbi:transposase [Streptomyces nigra]|uniref:transposase n=1 Tax=Streptomyces nigra TaxID=1827580 RepID=UPI003453EBBF